MRTPLSLAASPKMRRRALVMVVNAANSLILPLVSPLFSFLVIRLASVELWGEFVRVLALAQFGTHVVMWGNKDYLLREFSQNPAHLAQAWQTSLITRLALFTAFAAALAGLGVPPLRLLWLIFMSLAIVLDQAYDVFVLYKRDFAYSIFVELCGLALLAFPVISVRHTLRLDGLIILFGVSNLSKAGLFLWRFRRHTAGLGAGRFDLNHLRLAFPFFLLGFSGLMQSRIDLYIISLLLSRKEIGQYQVFTNLIICAQSVSGFVLVPFAKNLYRLSYSAILKISVRLFGLGLITAAAALPAIHLALRALYHIELSPVFLVWGALFVWPIYFYLPIIYALFKADQLMAVILINFAGMGVTLGLSLLLLPRLGMLGAVAASAATQWLMLAAYLLQGRSLRDEPAAIVSELS